MINEFKPNKARSKQTQTFRVGHELTLTVDKSDHSGQGICTTHAPVVFVKDGLPGEKLQVKVTQHKAKILQAEVKQVLSASEHRIEPFCPHYQQCGGCQLQHVTPDAALTYKQQAIEQLILHTRLPSQAGKSNRGLSKARQRKATSARTLQDRMQELPWQAPIGSNDKQYRRKTRLAVDARDPLKPKLGFRQPQSNAVFSLHQCRVLELPLQALIEPLQDLFAQLKRPGSIGHVSLLQGDECSQVCIRVTKTLPDEDLQRLTEFAKQQQVAVLLEDNEHQIQALADAPVTVSYAPQPGLSLQLHGDDFVQVNRQVNQAMIAQALDWLALKDDDQVLDLFCGVGNFSLPMAQHCKQVVGAEGVAKMVHRATVNAQQNGIHNCRFVHADLSEAEFFQRAEVKACNKVLLDPARDGAYTSVQHITLQAPSHILYVSCNPATFARDAAQLIEAGYGLTKIASMDMFPYTAHTELMALFVPS